MLYLTLGAHKAQARFASKRPEVWERGWIPHSLYILVMRDSLDNIENKFIFGCGPLVSRELWLFDVVLEDAFIFFPNLSFLQIKPFLSCLIFLVFKLCLSILYLTFSTKFYQSLIYELQILKFYFFIMISSLDNFLLHFFRLVGESF